MSVYELFDMVPFELSAYEAFDFEPFKEDTQLNAEEIVMSMDEQKSVFPEVHRFGQEKIAVFGKEKESIKLHVTVAADNDEIEKMEDYFRHETAHFFGAHVEKDATVDDATAKRAMQSAARIEEASAALEAYRNRDNVNGKDVPPGTIYCTDLLAGLYVVSGEDIDLQLADMLNEDHKEVEFAVRHGAAARVHYYQEIGRVKEKDEEAFEALRCAADLTSMCKAVAAVKSVVSRRHAMRFEEALTKVLNDVVRIALGTGIHASSFTEDLGPLAEMLLEKYGEDSAVYTTFAKELPLAVGGRCGMLLADEDGGDYGHVLIGLWQQIPAVAANLNFAIGDSKPYGFVSESRFPELYKAIESLLEESTRTTKESEFFDVRMETSDGYAIHCHRSLLGNKLLISSV